MEDPADDASKGDAYTTAKPSKFHFKSSSRRKRHHDDDADRSHRSSKRHRSDHSSSHRHHHRRKHTSRHPDRHPDRHPTSTVDGTYYDPSSRHRESLLDAPPSPSATTFRESLFDALADDEGAAYWEAVYGQPITIYPDSRPGPDGTLERMTDDEYAQHVRAKMWEKTHQHVVQEREARERARRERKEARERGDEGLRQEEREREALGRRMEESLRRGEARRRAKEATRAWDVYGAKWAALDTPTPETETAAAPVRERIPWPVFGFLRAAPAWGEGAGALLKAERVRWHPDKMQRRFGQRIDEQTLRDVTAVFQIIDQLWSARR
ncbi:hypothetical protein C7974DRAFT_396582 [Boeremia exigua]|uniref:uncharacterized protein n=1 Tax=Boeremia exigua TaxID=749465 RepID=UPI001E8E5811|nr:uncharacterized protein C7974DRAFT_396582 [Boeremia exigua]KAH6625708.1 hypothetical protein C7974DRAFT_396582 [Boeremia exigua]